MTYSKERGLVFNQQQQKSLDMHGSYLLSILFPRKHQSELHILKIFLTYTIETFKLKIKSLYCTPRNNWGFPQVSHIETFSSRTSNIIIQIKHPVICTQATQFVYIPPVHLHTAINLQYASGYTPEATKAIIAGYTVSQVTCSRLYGLWRCDFSFLYNMTTLPFVTHSHYRLGEGLSPIHILKHMPPREE